MIAFELILIWNKNGNRKVPPKCERFQNNCNPVKMPLEEWSKLDALKYIIANEDPATLIVIRIFYQFCGACWVSQPVFLDIIARNEKKARWIQMDADRSPGVTGYFNIKKVPTFIAIKNKLEVGRYVGTHKKTMYRFFEDMVKEYGWNKPQLDDATLFTGWLAEPEGFQ